MAKTRKHCKLCQHPDRDQLEERLSSKQVTPDELDEEMGWTSGVSARHLRNHMDTDYTDQSNPKCALCVSPERKVLEMAIHEGEISPSTVAADLGISRQQVMKHMNKHLKPLVQQSAAMEIMKRDLNLVFTTSQQLPFKVYITIIITRSRG